MNSKRSYSNRSFLSGPLLVENLKRFWLGSVLAFIGYFLIVCMPILTLREAFQINNVLTGTYIPAALWAAGVPVVAALLIFRYLHQQSSAAIVHSMPLSRKQLYHTNFLSGAFLCLAPVLLVGVFLLLLRVIGGPVLPEDPSMGMPMTDVFTYGSILRFIVGLTMMTLIVYVISMLAAVLVGTSLMQALLSGILLVVFSGLILIVNGFGTLFLFGYSMPDSLAKLALYLCPVAGILADNRWVVLLGYLAAALVLYLVGYMLYQRRKMERATDTLTFDFSKPIVKYLLTFCGMSAFGFLFILITNEEKNRPMFFLGCALGALVTYVAVEMLIQKRFKIRGFVKGFGLFAIAAVILFAGYQFDVLGFEKSVPEAAEVAGIRADLVNYYLDETPWQGTSEDLWIRDEGLNEAATDLHKSIVSAKADLQEIDRSKRTDTVNFVYKMKNGRVIRRNYELPAGWLSESAEYKKMVETRAYKAAQYPVMDWESAAAMKVDAVSVMPCNDFDAGLYGKYPQTLTDKGQFEELLKALQQDLEDLTIEGMDEDRPELLNVEFRIPGSPRAELTPADIQAEIDAGGFYSGHYQYREVRVTEAFDRTIALLKEWGIYDAVVLRSEDVHHLEVVLRTGSEEEGYEDSSVATLTDPAQIQQILEAGLTGYDGERYYEVTVFPKDYPEESNYWLYLPEAVAPEFIRNAAGS